VRDGASASASGTEVVARLAALVGEGHVVTDPAALAPYGRDKSPFPELVPAVVVRPADVAEVAAVVALANELRRFASRGLADLGLGLKIVFAPLTRHAVYTSISITYDPSVAGGREATAHLAREAYELVAELGGYAEPHQGEAARILAGAWSPEYARLVSRIKAALDPNDILNPGLWST